MWHLKSPRSATKGQPIAYFGVPLTTFNSLKHSKLKTLIRNPRIAQHDMIWHGERSASTLKKRLMEFALFRNLITTTIQQFFKPILQNYVFFTKHTRIYRFWVTLFRRPRDRAFSMYFPESFFLPFFKDFPKDITFFNLQYKTFYSHTLRLLEHIISYFNSREQRKG